MAIALFHGALWDEGGVRYIPYTSYIHENISSTCLSRVALSCSTARPVIREGAGKRCRAAAASGRRPSGAPRRGTASPTPPATRGTDWGPRSPARCAETSTAGVPADDSISGEAWRRSRRLQSAGRLRRLSDDGGGAAADEDARYDVADVVPPQQRPAASPPPAVRPPLPRSQRHRGDAETS